ncbi:hypothetical protein ACIOHC_36115 [Streptomyces sp. NPDC088252]|uniref:hypothetical protein n=1 Tax=Streptomyces sp. NPDC088252 TaxID=3365845 RepID=UPI00382210A2
MTADVPMPEEFRPRADTYSGIVPMHVDGDYYKDGVLVQAALRTSPTDAPEDEPGWTVQGR